ncbi:hypothetical protein DM860_001137 [Cuscuta australis]|uniref:Uncharacterized protein n=1 Tax=Cuscuta australis TaxID=267555 RepID=A0A328DSW3_9ASTE|nr:hypothetical protein DM860_001137 [Cuscuta australis]
MAFLAITEVCDSNEAYLASGDLLVLHPNFQIFGQCRAFSGPIVTLKVFEDNVLVREILYIKTSTICEPVRSIGLILVFLLYSYNFKDINEIF